MALLMLLAAAPVAGQSSVRLEQEARFTKVPGAQALGTLLPGAEVTPGRTQRTAVQIGIEGWLPSAALAARRRDSFDVLTSRRPTVELRNAPDGATIARVSPNVGFIRVAQQGDWTRVRRTAWMDQKLLPATPAAPSAPSGPDLVEVIRKAGLAVAPEAAVVGSIDSGAGARVLSRSGGWTRVQLEMWVPDSVLRSTDNRILAGVSSAEVRANPARYVGQMVEWRVQFIAVQKADELRPEIPEGQPYLLTRGPLPEPGFVYVVVPSSQASRFESVPSLKELVIRGTIRAASTKYLPTPVLDLVEVVEGPANQERPR